MIEQMILSRLFAALIDGTLIGIVTTSAMILSDEAVLLSVGLSTFPLLWVRWRLCK